METPRYITQITSDWLREVTRNTNLKAGPGIKITPDGDGLKIEIDQDTFKQWIWSAVKHRIMFATPPLGLVPIADLGSISLDPGA